MPTRSNKTRRIIFIIFIISGLAIPIFVWSQGILSGPIVPCGRTSPCTLCDIFKMLKNIIDFLLLAVFAVATVFIVIGGVRLLVSGGSPEQVDKGKRTITYAVAGVLIALVSWVLLAELFFALVGRQTAEEGRAEGFPWPWNEINCVGGGLTEGEELTSEGEYCVCENPRPSNGSHTVGTDIKVTNLTSTENCKNNCVSGNASQYCSSSLYTTKLYCVDEESLDYLQACRLSNESIGDGQGCRLGKTCFTTNDTCVDASLTTYESRCYLDNTSICSCISASQKNLCSNSGFVLWKWREERFNTPTDQSLGSYNAFECSQGAYGNSGFYCRKNCGANEYTLYGQCDKVVTNRCTTMSPAQYQTAPCSAPYSAFTCQQGVNDQWIWACDELKTFLTCMAGKTLTHKEISSIMDNSPRVGNSTAPGCRDLWHTPQCSASQDSCSGTCCAHDQNSLHYGGQYTGGTCRQCSWAVDFVGATRDEILTAATQCLDSTGWDRDARNVQVIDEGNHVHVGLRGVAYFFTNGAARPRTGGYGCIYR